MYHNRCFVIGDGPSLENIDLGLLDDDYKICVESAFLKTTCDAVVFYDMSFLINPEVVRELQIFRGDLYGPYMPPYFDEYRFFEIPVEKSGERRCAGIDAIEVGLDLAKKVFLIGYDNEEWVRKRVDKYAKFPRDRVFNCSAVSPINNLRFIQYQDAVFDDSLERGEL